MELKLNDSEIMTLLAHIDDALTFPAEGLERTTLLNIMHKINDQIQFRHHNEIDNFCIELRKCYEEAI